MHFLDSEPYTGIVGTMISGASLRLKQLGCRVIIALIMALLASWDLTVSTLHAEVYQYIDASGTIALTNVPSDARYRRIELDSSSLHTALSERELAPVIARHSRQHQLHPALIRAIIKAESNFDPHAISRAGAIGLMQLMPQTAVRLDVRDLYDPDDNVGGGTKYLRQLLDRFHGNLPLALAAYNAGENVVDRYQTLPPIDETRQYVRKVLRYYRTFLTRDGFVTERPVSQHVPASPAQDPASSATSAR